MIRKIALEEHFMLPEMAVYYQDVYSTISKDNAPAWMAYLSDFGQMRLETMDAAGIERSVLSLPGPGVQREPDIAKAAQVAASCNNVLAAKIASRPDRFSAFAHLPMQAPDAAIKELERCVKELGFVGALICGQTNGVYLDDPRYEDFWAAAAALKAPIYLHPANPVNKPDVYAGQDALWGSLWSWMAETSAHALRLVVGGVFERHPQAKLILGHMGECIPFHLWRIDNRYTTALHTNGKLPRPPSFYIRRNIFITTSGVFDDAPLRCSIDEIGSDNIMFSVDYPYEDSRQAGDWIEKMQLDPALKAKICYENAKRILNLKD